MSHLSRALRVLFGLSIPVAVLTGYDPGDALASNLSPLEDAAEVRCHFEYPFAIPEKLTSDASSSCDYAVYRAASITPLKRTQPPFKPPVSGRALWFPSKLRVPLTRWAETVERAESSIEKRTSTACFNEIRTAIESLPNYELTYREGVDVQTFGYCLSVAFAEKSRISRNVAYIAFALARGSSTGLANEQPPAQGEVNSLLAHVRDVVGEIGANASGSGDTDLVYGWLTPGVDSLVLAQGHTVGQALYKGRQSGGASMVGRSQVFEWARSRMSPCPPNTAGDWACSAEGKYLVILDVDDAGSGGGMEGITTWPDMPGVSVVRVRATLDVSKQIEIDVAAFSDRLRQVIGDAGEPNGWTQRHLLEGGNHVAGSGCSDVVVRATTPNFTILVNSVRTLHVGRFGVRRLLPGKQGYFRQVSGAYDGERAVLRIAMRQSEVGSVDVVEAQAGEAMDIATWCRPSVATLLPSSELVPPIAPVPDTPPPSPSSPPPVGPSPESSCECTRKAVRDVLTELLKPKPARRKTGQHACIRPDQACSVCEGQQK